IRNDPKWGSIPVLFLTGHTEIESVRAVFAAGADDYVSKPVVGPELIMRIENRIERSRFRGVAGATAGPGGVKGREAAREDIARVIALAARCDRDATVAKVAVDGVEA